MAALKGAARGGGAPAGLGPPHQSTEVANGSLYVGSPETVATTLAATIQALGLGRFDLVSGVGTVPHEERMATIELYGREVIPRVRELFAAAPSFA